MRRYDQANCETGVVDLFQFIVNQSILRVWRDKSHIFMRYCFLAWYTLEYSPYNTLSLIIDIVKASRLIFIPSAQIFCLQHAIVFEICEIHFWYRNKISVLPSIIPVTVTYSKISCLNGYTRLKKALLIEVTPDEHPRHHSMNICNTAPTYGI